MEARAQQGGGTIAASDLERLRAPLMRFFLRRTSDRALAEDLTQECFTAMLAMGPRDDVRDVDGYVFRVALNLLGQRGRKLHRQQLTPMPSADMHAVSGITHEFVEDRSPERILSGKQDIAAVVRALDELGERTRDIFILFRLEKMKHADIAALFGISRSTVEKEVMRATLHLSIRFGKQR